MSEAGHLTEDSTEPPATVSRPAGMRAAGCRLFLGLIALGRDGSLDKIEEQSVRLQYRA